MTIVRWRRSRPPEVGRSESRQPPVDIHEEDGEALVITAELPGVRKEDISVSVENRALTLMAERPPEKTTGGQLHRAERWAGTFERRFSLPRRVDGGKVGARYSDGVLTLRLPFREEAKPRTITIKTA